jgi:hypothetical protein
VKGNFHARFLAGREWATARAYPVRHYTTVPMTLTETNVFDARFVFSLWLPFSAVVFTVVALFPFARRHLRGQSVTLSWIGIARGIGCFAGLWSGGLAIWLFAHGQELYTVWLFGLLGFLLAFPWRVITRASIWWGLFAVLVMLTVVPLLALGWLFIGFVLSPPHPQGIISWPASGLLPVAFLALQVFAVWRLRRRSFRYDHAA